MPNLLTNDCHIRVSTIRNQEFIFAFLFMKTKSQFERGETHHWSFQHEYCRLRLAAQWRRTTQQLWFLRRASCCRAYGHGFGWKSWIEVRIRRPGFQIWVNNRLKGRIVVERERPQRMHARRTVYVSHGPVFICLPLRAKPMRTCYLGRSSLASVHCENHGGWIYFYLPWLT